MKSIFVFGIFLLCTFVASSASIVWTVGGEGEWFESLVRPSIAPPNWVFGPVWTTLYVMISVSAWLLVSAVDNRENKWFSIAISLWALQMCINVIWTPVFFGAENLTYALYYIVVLWATILAYIIVSWQVDRKSSILFIPYFLWVSFATALNYSYVHLN